MKRWGGEGRKRRGEKCPQSRKRSHGNAKCPDVAVPNTGAARTGLKRGEHDKLPSLMPISAILLYEQRSEGTWRGFLGLSLPPPLSIPTFHRPRFTKRLGVFIALIYIRNVYTENARRHIYIYIYTCTPFYVCVLYATVSIAPCQVPARIIRGERARNTHVLARIPLERSHTHATFASTYRYIHA